jgi:hypothetical protein
MAILTREERRRRVLELHNQGLGTREIAETLKMSFRDIGPILNDADKKKEIEQQQARQEFQSSRAYKLFSEGKTPVQVAIELNLRESEVNGLCREYWNLVQLDNLNKIYKEIGHDIWFLVELYRLAKAGGFRVGHVVRLLRIANNDLASLESRHQILTQEVKTLESEKRTSSIIFQDLTDQITHLHKISEDCQSSCKKEMGKMDSLYHKKMKLEALVKQFENNNKEYVMIRKTVEEKVISTLSDGKMLLKLAVLSIIESIRSNPDKYRSLSYDNNTSSPKSKTDYSNQQYFFPMDGQYRPCEDYYSNACINMLIEESEKLYNKLAKPLVDKIINDYGNRGRTSSLPSLPPPDE